MTRPHISVVPAAGADEAAAWLRSATVQRDGAVVVHVAAETEDLPRLASVIAAVEAREAFDQLVLDAGAGPGVQEALAQLGAAVRVHGLSVPPEVPEDVHAALETLAPTAVVIHVDDHPGLCCAIAAAHLGISIVRVGGVPADGIGRVIARLADVLLTRSPVDTVDQPALLPPERVTVVGNPLVDVVRHHARAALDMAAWRRCDVAPGSYVLAVLTGRVPFAAVEPALTDLAAQHPLVLEAPARWQVPGAHRVFCRTFVERLSLERTANTIVTDSERVYEEAAVLGVPCHALDAGAVLRLAGTRELPRPVSAWDGRAGERAADALVANYARLRLTAEAP